MRSFVFAACLLGCAPYAVNGQNPAMSVVGRLGTTRFRHPEAVQAILFTPDGKRIVSCGGDVRVWDAATGVEIRRWAIASQQVSLSPDGRLLLAGGTVLDLETGAETLKLDKPQSRGVLTKTQAVQINDRGFLDRTDLKTGEGLDKLIAPQPHGSFDYCLAASHDTIAAGNTAKLIGRWDAESGKAAATIEAAVRVRTLAFSSDGKLLASAGEGRTIEVWNRDGDRMHELRSNSSLQTSLAFTLDGSWLASGEADGSVTLWDMKTGKPRPFTRLHRAVSALSFSPDGKTLALSADDASIRLFEVESAKEAPAPDGHRGGIEHLAAGKYIVTSSNDGAVLVWDPASRQCLKTLPHEGTVTSLAISKDGSMAASTGDDATIRVWDWEQGKERLRVPGANRRAQGLVFDERRILWALEDGTRKAWNLDTGELALDIQGHGAFEGHAYNERSVVAGETLLAAGQYDHSVAVWRIGSGARALQLKDVGFVSAVALSADERWLAAGCIYEEPIRIFETAAGRPAFVLPQDEKVSAIAFSGRGYRVAWGNRAGRLRVWDLTLGKQVAEFQTGDGRVTAISFLGDDETIVAGFSNSTALILRIEVREVLPKVEPEKVWEALLGDEGAASLGPLAAWPQYVAARLKEDRPADPQVARWIQELEDDSEPVRTRAQEQLMKSDGERQIESLLRSSSAELRERARQILEAMGGPRLENVERRRRARGVIVLEWAGALEALRSLAASSPWPDVRRASASAARRLDLAR